MHQPKSCVESFIVPVVILIIAMVSIQTGAAMAKQLFPVFGPTGTAALRLCFASMILCLIWRPWRLRLTMPQFMPILYYGLAMGGMNLLIYLSLDYIPLGIAVALEFVGPLAVALYGSRRVPDLVWVVFALAGIILLMPAVNSQELHLLGILYALGAGLCWALYIIFGQKAGAIAPGGLVTTIGMLVAASFVIPAGILNQGANLLHYLAWPTALAVALLSSAIPYYLEMMALKSLPSATFGILMSIEPAIAALSGVIMLSENLTIMQWAAIACIMMASAGSALNTRRASGTPELSA